MIKKQFITYNLKIKGHTPCHILLIEVSLFPVANMTMFRYLMYKRKLYNMEAKKFPKIATNSSQNPQLRLKWGWHNDAQSSLVYLGIKEEIILEMKDKIKNTITSKLKEKLWKDKELEGKRKLKYYKEVINLTLADQNYLFSLTNYKKKMNFAKIRTNSDELQSEIRH